MWLISTTTTEKARAVHTFTYPHGDYFTTYGYLSLRGYCFGFSLLFFPVVYICTHMDGIPVTTIRTISLNVLSQFHLRVQQDAYSQAESFINLHGPSPSWFVVSKETKLFYMRNMSQGLLSRNIHNEFPLDASSQGL